MTKKKISALAVSEVIQLDIAPGVDSRHKTNPGQETDFALLAPLAMQFLPATELNFAKFTQLVNCTDLKLEQKYDIISSLESFDNYELKNENIKFH